VCVCVCVCVCVYASMYVCVSLTLSLSLSLSPTTDCVTKRVQTHLAQTDGFKDGSQFLYLSF
jgi:hypothetical protein